MARGENKKPVGRWEAGDMSVQPNEPPQAGRQRRGGPAPKDAGVSQRMTGMPRASTKPEVALRRALHARGLRFRIHRRDLPGTPDIVLPAARLAVFVDGCFWHACPSHGVIPKNNRAWWEDKLARNAERDARKDAELMAMGWTPVHLWEHMPLEDMVEHVVHLWIRHRRV